MQRSRVRLGGWTLIELFVVMGIIGILAALLIPSTFSIYDRARKTQAQNDLTQIVTAVNAFYTEYGKYPIATAGADVTYPPGPGGSNADLFYSLRAVALGANALVNGVPAINPRAIVYISPRVFGTTPARSGIGSDGQFYDPWTTPYYVEIDGNYDNSVTNPYSGGAGVNPIPQGVIGWSLGKDRQLGTKGNGIYTVNGDDVISWQ